MAEVYRSPTEADLVRVASQWGPIHVSAGDQADSIRVHWRFPPIGLMTQHSSLRDALACLLSSYRSHLCIAIADNEGDIQEHARRCTIIEELFGASSFQSRDRVVELHRIVQARIARDLADFNQSAPL